MLQNPKYEGAHAFQSEILLLAERSLVESVFRGVDERRREALERLYIRGTDYLFFGPVFARVEASGSRPGRPLFDFGPRWAFAVALKDGWKTP